MFDSLFNEFLSLHPTLSLSDIEVICEMEKLALEIFLAYSKCYPSVYLEELRKKPQKNLRTVEILKRPKVSKISLCSALKHQYGHAYYSTFEVLTAILAQN
jgi:hypothetical protein